MDPVVDNDVLVRAWRATRRTGASVTDGAALTLLSGPSHAWLLTPTVYKEFTKVPTGSASRKRFLRRLANLTVLTSQAAVLRQGPRFLQVFVELRRAANQSRVGLGNRPVRGGLKSDYNDIVNAAFAEELAVPFVTADQKFLNFLSTYGRPLSVQAVHFLLFP